ncbi:hypothetical protein AB0H83_40390 [Dactylosporangium sp. NPDC050688]|uniref:hypothetical protein n=1 Tax=Dactylosporangium sp. NPDC050688 TaxID=3157217 RepID=UPI0033E4337B
MTPLRQRVLITAAIASLATIAPAGAAAAAPAAADRSKINITSLGFAADTVDATGGPASVELKWAVADADTTATTIRGSVELRLFNGTTAVGPVKGYTWALQPDGIAEVFADDWWSATAQQSSYTLNFVVPQYGPAEQVTWRVTRFTATDDRGNSKSLDKGALSRFDSSVAATELVDTAVPELETFARGFQSEFFQGTAPVTLKYQLSILEQAGFWKGKLKLAGPGGARVTTAFELVKVNPYTWMCGDSQNYDNQWVQCDLSVTLPVMAPAGVWRVAGVELTDTTGRTGDHTVAVSNNVRTTRNAPLSASGFALSATEVDNWRQEATVRVSMRPAGAQGAITSVRLTSSCWQRDTVPQVAVDGTVSVEMVVPTFLSRCDITGIALDDASGDLALYGTSYGNAGLGLVVTRKPDTVPPVVLSSALPKSTWTQAELETAWGIGINVVVDTSSPAPVTQFSTTVFNAEGHSVGGGSGGIQEGADGALNISAHVGVLPVGQYTIGFTLTDAAGNYVQLGYPNRDNPPGGPLILTVVA